MIQIRKGVFETNSSSTHSIVISKKKIGDVKGKHIDFASGDYGWENECYIDTANYLYTAIVCGFGFTDIDKVDVYINKLKSILDECGITYKFAPIEKVESSWEKGSYYYRFKDDEWAGIDHATECHEFVEAVMNDKNLLLRYLFGDSCIYTGNDNSNESTDDCYSALDYAYDDNWETITNPKHDKKHYDYFFKGN